MDSKVINPPIYTFLNMPDDNLRLHWLKIILVALASFILFSTTFYLGYWCGTQQTRQTEKPTSGWETFTNDYQNYSVRIPPGWKAEIHGEDLKRAEEIWVTISPPDLETQSVYFDTVTSNFGTFKEVAEHWRDYYLTAVIGPVDIEAFVESEKEITVEGKTGIRYNVAVKDSNRRDVLIYLPTNDENRIFRIWASDPDGGPLLKRFDQMFSTFRLLD